LKELPGVDLDEVLAATFSLVAPHLTERQAASRQVV
jgi:hypothetical protein